MKNIKDLKKGTYKVLTPPPSASTVSSSSNFPTEEPEEVKKSFSEKLVSGAGTFVKGVVNPFARTGVSIYNDVIASPVSGVNSLVRGRGLGQAAADFTKEADATRNIAGMELSPLLKVNPQATGDTYGIRTALSGAGTAAELASFAIGGGGAGRTALAGGVKQAIGQGAKYGVASGALSGFGTGLQDENATFGSVAINTTVGGVMGGVAGGVLGGVFAGISKGLEKLSAKPTGFTPKENKIITKRLGELDKLEGSYKALRNQSAKAQQKGIEVKKLLAETDLLHNSVDNTGTIRTTEAIAELNDFIRPQESVIGETLQREGKRIPLGLVKQKLVQNVNASGLKGGAKLRALKNVEDDIAGYALDADKDGYIALSIIHDAKVDKYANLNYMNPESKRADKAIAKGLKELVENYTDSVDVKALNGELSRYFTLQNYLEALDGKKVAGGKLGKYFAQTVGSIVGSHFGPVGTIVGAEVGGKVKGAQMASKFAQPIGKNLEQSPAMQNAIKANIPSVIELPPVQSKSLGSLNKTQSTTMTSIKNGIKKVNDALNEVTPGNYTKSKFTITYTNKSGKKVVMKDLARDEAGGWVKWLKEQGLKHTVKAAGAAAVAGVTKKSMEK